MGSVEPAGPPRAAIAPDLAPAGRGARAAHFGALLHTRDCQRDVGTETPAAEKTAFQTAGAFCNDPVLKRHIIT